MGQAGDVKHSTLVQQQVPSDEEGSVEMQLDSAKAYVTAIGLPSSLGVREWAREQRGAASGSLLRRRTVCALFDFSGDVVVIWPMQDDNVAKKTGSQTHRDWRP
jgi:hypothetical protein